MGISSVRVMNRLSQAKPATDLSDEGLTISSSAVAFADVAAAAPYVYVTIDGADVRCTFDGSAPTGANGHFLGDGYQDLWSRELFNASRFIRDAAVDAYGHATPMG
ncbi:MAG: hypothetical protein OES34_10805 [Nitrosopumilus sp.]|nr:hypothetical protein [Nitrosopumilus sp.]